MVNPAGSACAASSFTCTVDGLDHLVSDDAAARGIAANKEQEPIPQCADMWSTSLPSSPTPVHYVPVALSWHRKFNYQRSSPMAEILAAGALDYGACLACVEP